MERGILFGRRIFFVFFMAMKWPIPLSFNFSCYMRATRPASPSQHYHHHRGLLGKERVFAIPVGGIWRRSRFVSTLLLEIGRAARQRGPLRLAAADFLLSRARDCAP